MAKKLDTGDMSYDSGLDFDFSTDIKGNLNQKSTSKRGVVGNVSRGIITGVKDSATSPSFIKSVLRKSLPGNYGVVADGADTVLTESYRLYDQSVKELKPRLGAITRKIDTLIPEGQKTLKGLSKKMMSLTGEDRNTAYANTENQEDQAVTQALGAIFAQNKQYTQDAERKQIMRDGIDLKRDTRDANFLSNIARNTSIQTQYTTSVTQAYQKKMLELQLRGYIAAKEHYATTTKFFQMFQEQNEAIVKNTSMPEFQKITNSERFLEAGKNKFFNGLFGKGSALDRGMGRLKESGLEMLEGLKMGLDSTNMLADEAISGKQAMDDMNKMLVEMGEEPLSKMEMIGGVIGGNIVEYIASKISPKVKKNLQNDKKFQKNLARVARMVTNPAGAIEELRNTQDWQNKTNDFESMKGKGYRFLDAVMDHFRETTPRQGFKSTGSLGDLSGPAMGFDNKAHLSLTDVIPGYLASILREAQIARTGNQNTPLQVYNFKSGEFVTDKNMKGIIAKDLISKVKGSASRYHIEKTAREFGDIETLSPSGEFEIKVFFSKLARITNMEFTPENIMDTKAFESLSPSVKAFVEQKLQAIADSPEREFKTTGMTKSIMGIRNGMPGLGKEMDEYIKAGYGKQLKELGLIRRDEDGEYERNEEAYNKFLDTHGVARRKVRPGEASSDINVKESIRKMNPTELLSAVKSRFSKSKPNDFMGPQQTMVQRTKSSIKNWDPRAAYEGIKKTGLFGWKYKAGEGDGSDEERYGPMAQDVNRNMGEESAPGGKKIDLVNINGAAMAAVKHLGAQVDKLGFWKSGNPLSLIQKDVSALLSIAKGGKGGRGRRGRQGGGVAMGNSDYVQGEGYAPLLTNMVQSIAKLGTQVSSDVFTSAGKVFSFGKDKVAMPVIDYAKKAFNDKDNPIRKGVTTLWEKATTMASDVMAFGSKLATDTLPAGWKQIKDFGKNLYEEASKRLNEARDLYLPGGAKPIIRAIKLRSGFYRDSETGEPIFTMDGLLKCKNDIVDKAGNVVLTLEEKAQGLIDAHGERVKTTAMNFLNAGIGMAFAAKDRVVESFKFLREKGSKALSGLGGKIKDKWDQFDGSSFGGFGGKYLKDGYQVWVDIRTIMLGGADEVRKRLKSEGEAKALIGAAASVMSGGGGGSDDESESHVNEAQDADTSTRYGGGSGGGSIRDRINNAVNTGRGWFDKATGKTLTDKEKKARAGKIQHAKNKAKGMFYKTRKKLLGTNWGAKGADYVEKMRNSKGAGWVSGKFNAAKSSSFGQRMAGWGGKAKTFGKALPGKFGTMVGIASNFFGGGNGQEEQKQDPEDAANNPERAKELGEGKEGEVKLNEGKGKVSLKDRVFGDSDGDGDVDGSVSDQAAKNEALKKARTKKGAEADLTQRYKNGEKLSGFFDKLLAGASTIFSLATSGIGGLFKGVGTLLGGALKGAKAITSTAGKLLPSAGTVAKGAWEASKFVGKNALRVAAWTAMEAIPALASGALAVASTVASAIGSVIASPVVLGAAAIALAGYGIYKLYKYANRNNASDIERIRLRQYGVSNRSTEDQYNHLFYTLEAYLLDGRVDFSGNKASLIEKNIKAEEIAEIFGVDKKDTDHIDAVATWFSKRFKPFFLTHVTALYNVNSKTKLLDIESLKAEEKLRYVQAVTFESGPWGVDISPVKAIDSLNTDNTQCQEAIKIILDKLTAQTKKESKAIALPAKSGAEQTDEATRAQADYSMQQRDKKTKADLGVNNIGKNSDALKAFASPTGEDGPRKDVTAALTKGAGGAPSSISMAGGAPLDGADGMQFLKLGKGVNVKDLHPGTLKLLLGMAQEYGSLTGKSIQINDGFRSMEQQAALHSANPAKAAKPGLSLHQYGLAVDVNSADADALEKLGLMKKYGFTRPVGGEPWHMEPAGIQRNIDLARKNAAQRDTMVDASPFKGGGGYATQPNAVKYKRNHELAVSLLDVPGKLASEQTAGAKKDEPGNAIATDGKSMSVNAIRPEVAAKEAANDSQSKTNVIAISDKASTSNKLPLPDSNVPTTDSEASGKPDQGREEKTASDGSVKDTIAKAARRAGGDPNMMLAFAAVESDMNPNAKGSGTSKGAFGFIDSTWNETLGKYGSKYSLGKDAKSTDVEASALMATEYLKSSLKSISKVRPNPTFTDAYLTHLLGAGGARTFFGAEPTAIAAEVLPKAAANNKGIFYEGNRPRTIKEVYAEVTRRLQTKTAKYGINVNFGSMASSSAESKPTGMKDGNGQGITGGLPGTPAAEPVPTKGPAPGTPGVASVKPSSSGGLFVDSRASGFDNTPSKGTGQAMAGPSSTKLEAGVDKSNELLGSQLSVLKDILTEVKSDKLINALKEAMAAMSKNASNDGESMKEKDKRNMGRRDTAVNSSVDFSRKSM